MKKFIVTLAAISSFYSAESQSFSSYVWEQKAKYGDTVKVDSTRHSHIGIIKHPAAKYKSDRETIGVKRDDRK